MPNYTRFVEYGRLVLTSDKRLAVITNIADVKTVQIQGPKVPRQIVSIAGISLTGQVAPQEKPLKKDEVDSVFKDLAAQFEQTEEGRELKAAALRKGLNDFDRFKAQRLQALRNARVREIMAKK